MITGGNHRIEEATRFLWPKREEATRFLWPKRTGFVAPTARGCPSTEGRRPQVNEAIERVGDDRAGEENRDEERRNEPRGRCTLGGRTRRAMESREGFLARQITRHDGPRCLKQAGVHAPLCRRRPEVVVGDGRYVRMRRVGYKRRHSVAVKLTIPCPAEPRDVRLAGRRCAASQFGRRYRDGRRSWHCRKITPRSMRIPPGPSTQMSMGCCLKTLQAKSIALEGTA